MCNRPIGYPKCKRGFPWLVYIRENSKEMALVLFKVIMVLIILLALASRVKVLIWSFISEGRFSIILRILLGSAEEEPKDEDEEGDGSIIGYTHKGGGIIVVLRAGGFLERSSLIRLSLPLMCLT